MNHALRTLACACALAIAGVAHAADPVDINTADAATLAQVINGVGAERARAIVAYREQHGPFRTIDDLAQVSGIGERTVERNRDRLRAGSADR